MSVRATSSSRCSGQNTLYTGRLILQRKNHKVLIKLPDAGGAMLYQMLQAQAIQLFTDIGLNPAAVGFWSSELPGCEGEEIEISAEALTGLEDVIHKLIVKLR